MSLIFLSLIAGLAGDNCLLIFSMDIRGCFWDRACIFVLFRSLVQMPVYHCACLLLRLICFVVLSVHEAGRWLVQLEGKVPALEQKRTFETTESIFDGCS